MLRKVSLLLVLAGCGQFPNLDDTLLPEAKAANYPQPTSIQPTLIAASEYQSKSDAIQATTALQISRANALRSR